jgi:hypothetical protein
MTARHRSPGIDVEISGAVQPLRAQHHQIVIACHAATVACARARVRTGLNTGLAGHAAQSDRIPLAARMDRMSGPSFSSNAPFETHVVLNQPPPFAGASCGPTTWR